MLPDSYVDPENKDYGGKAYEILCFEFYHEIFLVCNEIFAISFSNNITFLCKELNGSIKRIEWFGTR